MLVNNWLYYTVQGFCFQRFLLIFLWKKIYIPVRENELKSICGKTYKISSLTCSLFIAGEFHKNKNTFLRGFILGKSDIISIGSPRHFPLATMTEKGQVIRLTSFIHSETLRSFDTIFQHYHLSTSSCRLQCKIPVDFLFLVLY